jgi:hypothetical protein
MDGLDANCASIDVDSKIMMLPKPTVAGHCECLRKHHAVQGRAELYRYPALREASRSCSAIQPTTAGMNHALPFRSGTNLGGRKSSADWPA